MINEEVHLLRELLAVLHRDGGHYSEKHGLEKSTADAINSYYELRQQKEELEQKNKEQAEELRRWESGELNLEV